MRAEAVLEVDRVAGVDRCTRMRSEPPLTLRQTGPGVVHQVGTAAGPLGGDDLRLRIRVGSAASLALRGVAAAVVLPGSRGGPSSSVVEVDVAAEGHADLRLPQQVVAAGADHRMATTVRLGPGATLEVREEVVLGRHGESPGSVHQRLAVDRDGRPLVRTDLAVGPRWPDSLGPAGLDGARAVGSVLLVGPMAAVFAAEARAPDLGRGASAPRSGCLVLGPDAVLLCALGPSPRGVAASLDAAVGLSRGFVST